MFLLDTNVVSEVFRSTPDAKLMAWHDRTPEPMTHLSVASIAEIRAGSERLAPSTRRDQIEAWLEGDLVRRFGERLLPIDHRVADLCGRLIGRNAARGLKVEVMDGMIAATAIHHGLTVVTRNVRHFEPLGIPVLNPWTV